MATLLKRKRKAQSVARIVCGPSRGEKAIRTPTEKASAVRSGGSSKASRRRKELRNIESREPLTVNRDEKESGSYSSRFTVNGSRLLITVQRLRLVLVYVEDGQELRDGEQVF